MAKVINIKKIVSTYTTKYQTSSVVKLFTLRNWGGLERYGLTRGRDTRGTMGLAGFTVTSLEDSTAD